MIRNATGSLLSALASVVRLVTSVIGGLILLYAVFVFFEANPDNAIVTFTRDVRNSLGGFTENLFTPDDKKIAETINAVLAALAWVLVGNIVSRVIARITPAKKASKS